MKKLLLMLAATAACLAFAAPAKAQTEIVVPISGYSFQQDPPSSMNAGTEFIMEFEMFANASDSLPGQTAWNILDVGLNTMGAYALLRVEEFVVTGRVGLYDYGWAKLKVLPNPYPVTVTLDFIYQSKEIKIY